jgi:glycine betaine/proline transport system substrate-binding protein
MNEGQKSEMDIEKHVETWIAKNKNKWNGWLAEARKAAK